MRCRRVNAGALISAGLVWCGAVRADVPHTINHQGLVQVDGVAFDGTGQFKFAILNAAGECVWTNDGSNLILNGVPDTFEDLEVESGIYSVILGGTGPGYTMTAIEPSVFNEPDRRLRIWFDDGINGEQQLTPDHSLASSPYGHNAANGALIGEVKMWAGPIAAIPPGWRHCNGAQVSRTQFAELFEVIGDIYGPGDLTTTFNLPNFSNRSPMGANADTGGAPTTTVQGLAVQLGGSATHILSIAEMPAHRHASNLEYLFEPNSQWGPVTTKGAASGTFSGASGTGSTGEGQPHNNVHPYFAIVYIIYTGAIE